MIGQYGSFDYSKYHRDFREGFYGIEACLFSQENDTANLIKEAKEVGFQVGVHFPLRAGISKFRDALFLSSNDLTRLQAYDSIQQELEFLAPVKPDYVLFHYPKPVVLDDRVDWSIWRFEDKSEFVYESMYSFNEFKEKSDALFEWLSSKGREYNFTPVLQITVNNIIEKSRYPVLPNQKPSDGWAPIEEYLHIINRENKDVKIMFEHRSELVSDEELWECYMWVDEILNLSTGNVDSK